MVIWNKDNHVFNIILAKLSGLFQILDPGSMKFLGQNVYHIVMTIIMLFTCVTSVVLIVSSMYYWSDRNLVVADYGCKGITSLFLAYKIWNVVYHSNEVWDCLKITRYDFTPHGARPPEQTYFGSLARTFGADHEHGGHRVPDVTGVFRGQFSVVP